MQLQHQQTSGQHKSPILIVDDSKVIRLALSKILRNDFEVIQAVDGEDAWTKLNENDAITAVFSDVSMPNLDGFGLLERVRNSSKDHIQHIPYIIITANDDDHGFAEKVARAGGDALITKPFKTDEISECVNKFISIHLAEASSVPGLSDKAVAEILGFEEADQVVTQEQQEIIPENIAYETVSAVETEVIPVQEEMHVETAEIEAPDYNKSGVEFTIDDDFLSNVLDNNEPENSADYSAIQESAVSELALEYQEDDNKADEIVLTMELPYESNLRHPESMAVEEQQPSTPGYDMKLSIEQARKRAMDIAREQAERCQQDIENDNARRESERNEIRKRLEALRVREAEVKVMAGSNKSLFLKKIMHIISGAFLFKKRK